MRRREMEETLTRVRSYLWMKILEDKAHKKPGDRVLRLVYDDVIEALGG